MRHRVYTDNWEMARYLYNYIYHHPAIYSFVDHSNELFRSDYCIHLTNGSTFLFGPRDARIDRGIHYDKYTKYTDDRCPLDVLLLVIEEIVK